MAGEHAAFDELFRGIRAYFVESGMQPRRLKIWSQKIQQLGGAAEDHLSHETTHVFALDIHKLREKVSLQKLKDLGVKALSYEWIQDCLEKGLVLPSDPYVLKSKSERTAPTGFEEAHGENTAEGASGKSKRSKRLDVLDHQNVPLSSVNNPMPRLNNLNISQISKSMKHEWERKQAVVDSRSDQKSAREGTSSAETGSEDSGMEVLSPAIYGSDRETSSPPSTYAPPNLNQNITNAFAELKDIYKDAFGDDRRSFSYHKAISVLEKLPFKVENVDQVKGLPTIGKSMLDNIHEILTTGTLSKLEHFKSDERVQTLILFSSIWGVGPVTAQKLFEKGHRSLDDLKDEPSLTAYQRVGLQFYNDIKAKIHRDEVQKMETFVKQAVECIQAGMVVVCGGSYRRGKSYCGDMDFVITHPDGRSHKGFLLKLVASLKDMDFLTEDLLISTESSQAIEPRVDTYYGLCTYGGTKQRHRIDFKVYPIEMYPFGLIAWTGNDVLNRRLRLIADNKGFKLDDTGLFPAPRDAHGQKVKTKGSTMHCKSEREVFEFLGFPWLEPHERNL